MVKMQNFYVYFTKTKIKLNKIGGRIECNRNISYEIACYKKSAKSLYPTNKYLLNTK